MLRLLYIVLFGVSVRAIYVSLVSCGNVIFL